MSEATNLTNAFLIEVHKRYPQVRCWRSNTGGGIGMSMVNQAIRLILGGDIKGGIALLQRPIKFGVLGGGDISGIAQVTIPASIPERTPIKVGVYLSIEVKAGKDRESDHQKAFAAMVTARGGVALICRDVEQCLADLGAALDAYR